MIAEKKQFVNNFRVSVESAKTKGTVKMCLLYLILSELRRLAYGDALFMKIKNDRHQQTMD